MACKKKLALRVWLAALPPLPTNWKFAGVLNTIKYNTRAHGCTCVTYKYTRVVKQSNSVSLENPTTEGGLSLADLSAKVIEHNHVVFNAQWVEQVKHCLCHHRRASSEVACKKKLAREFGLPHFLLSPKIKNFRGPRLLWVPLRFISHEKDNTWPAPLEWKQKKHRVR